MSRTQRIRDFVDAIDGLFGSVRPVLDAVDRLPSLDEILADADRWAQRQAGAGAGATRSPREEALEVLEFPANASPSAEDVHAAFKRLARQHHPDAGGSVEAFARLVRAREILCPST